MNRFLGVIAIVVLVSAAFPFAAHAQANLPLLNPDFEIVPDPSAHDAACGEDAPLSYGAVLQLVQNLMNAAIAVGILVMLITIIYAGALFLLSPTNPENRSKGRTMLTNVVIGFVIVLAAWLAVDALMKAVYNPNAVIDGSVKTGPWNTILGTSGEWCVKERTTRALFSGNNLGGETDILTGGGTGENTSGGTYTGGKCAIQSSGLCATENFQVFGSAASQASQICTAESANGTLVVSGVDKLGDGTPYSFGLFQINITANNVAGNNCPAAFSKQSCTVKSCGPGTGVTVVNRGLYERCREAALLPSSNIAAAKAVYDAAGKSWRPWGTAKGCGLSILTGSATGIAACVIMETRS